MIFYIRNKILFRIKNLVGDHVCGDNGLEMLPYTTCFALVSLQAMYTIPLSLVTKIRGNTYYIYRCNISKKCSKYFYFVYI